MEGLRPILDLNGKAQLTLQNGIFKNFCIEAAAWEKDVYAIPDIGADLAKKWLTLKIEDLSCYSDQLNGAHWEYIFQHLAPSKKVSDAVPPFFFIIDEINRAELSRVLGELMICLEYRGTEGVISTQYAALNTEETGMLAISGGRFKFFIPHNVYVIGTMNTIDRSVESFDLALRRRFRWERMDPDIVALRYHLKERDAKPGAPSWVGLADDLENLNQLITKTDLLGEDYQVGHAYLMNLRYSSDLNRSQIREKLWEDNIQPLLEEYLRGSGRSDVLLSDFKKAFRVT
jgi:5-methylcytosine-specific restriction protein B